jgi:hypothetical protein
VKEEKKISHKNTPREQFTNLGWNLFSEIDENLQAFLYVSLKGVFLTTGVKTTAGHYFLKSANRNL